MTIKGMTNLIILIVKEFITKLVLATYDVYGDWYIVYQILMGNGFATGQECKQGYYDNHIYIGILAITPLLLSFLFHTVHWWEKEKVENGGYGRLLTLPLLMLQIWPQMRWIKVLIKEH